MAFADVNDHGCPGCPPTSTEDVSSRNMKAAASSDISVSGCATGIENCELVAEFNYSGRATSVSIKDAPIDVPVGIAPPVNTILPVNDMSARPDVSDTFYLLGDSPPLRVLYCSYLI